MCAGRGHAGVLKCLKTFLKKQIRQDLRGGKGRQVAQHDEELKEGLEKVLRVFAGYYDINREAPLVPFDAEAEFRMHGEEFLLIRSAKITEMDSREFAFFATREVLTGEEFTELQEKAWDAGLARVKVGAHHRNSDVLLVILAWKVDADAVRQIRRSRHYRSYRFGLRGWSESRTAVAELSTGKRYFSRTGDTLKRYLKSV